MRAPVNGMPWWWLPVAAVMAVLWLGSCAARAEVGIVLGWDASPDVTVRGYKLYSGGTSRNYTNVVTVGNVTTNVVSGLRAGLTYFFAVTAYNANGIESDFSNEVAFTIPVAPPLKMVIRQYPRLTVSLAGSESVTGKWSLLTNVVFSEVRTNGAGFYEASMRFEP